jgi:DNA-binding transcriptional LysR family regulator
VRVAFREAYTRPLLERLARGRLDLALVHLGKGDGPPALKVNFERVPVEIERLYEEPLMLAVGPRHCLAGRGEVRWRDLAEEEFVSFGAGSTIRELATRAAREARLEMHATVSAANLGTIRALVSAGLGVAILPEVALTLPGPRLLGHRLTAPKLTRFVALARNSIRYQSPAARALTDFLRARLAP